MYALFVLYDESLLAYNEEDIQAWRDEVVSKTNSQPITGKVPDKKQVAPNGPLGSKRDEKPLIPPELDITRTKEFWENAVPS